MKFNEKLIKLRKEKGLSQEELGYELNVTRQTVSKWELGQTTPEMDKLLEMAKLFGISLDELTGDSKVIESTEQKKNTNSLGIILLIIIILCIIVFAVFKFLGDTFGAITGIFNRQQDTAEHVMEEASSMINKINDLQEKRDEQEEMITEQSEEIKEKANGLLSTVIGVMKNTQEEYDKEKEESKKRSFNFKLENNGGEIWASRVQTLLEDIVKSNQENTKQITVKYNEKETIDAAEIEELKKDFDNFNKKYEVSFDYDEDGYISKVTIEKI